MTVRSLRALLGASLLVTLGACGDDSSSSSGPSPVATLPLEYVSTFGGTGTSLPGLAFHAIGFEGTNINLSAGDAPQAAKEFLAARLSGVAGGTAVAAVLSSPDCTPDEVGAATDTDGDGIPDDATLTFTVANCTVYDTATGDAQLIRGKYRIQDTNDDLYGFTVTITNLHVRNFTTAGGSVYEVTYNATESATTRATSGSYRLTLAAAIAQGDTGGIQHQIVNYDLTGKFTPSGTITDGDPLPNGTFTLTGTLDATLDAFGPPTRMVMQVVTPTPMSFTTACGDVNNGDYELRLNGRTDEGVHIKFQACNGYYEILGSDAL